MKNTLITKQATSTNFVMEQDLRQAASAQSLVYLSPWTDYSIAIARISYGNSVCPSVCLSRPGTNPRPGEIETSGFHHMIA